MAEECLPGEVPREKVDVVLSGARFVLLADVVADKHGDTPVSELAHGVDVDEPASVGRGDDTDVPAAGLGEVDPAGVGSVTEVSPDKRRNTRGLVSGAWVVRTTAKPGSR